MSNENWIDNNEIEFKYMGFDDALKALFIGKKVRREGWNSKNIFVLAHIPPNGFYLNAPFLVIDTSNAKTDNHNYKKVKAPYTPSQCDIFANDWIIFKNKD